MAQSSQQRQPMAHLYLVPSQCSHECAGSTPHSFSFHSSTDYTSSMRAMKLRSWREDIEHHLPHPLLLTAAQSDSSIHIGYFITGCDTLQTLQTGLQAASSPPMIPSSTWTTWRIYVFFTWSTSAPHGQTNSKGSIGITPDSHNRNMLTLAILMHAACCAGL